MHSTAHITVTTERPAEPPTDAELLRRHRAGCPDAYRDLVTRHERLLGWTVRQAGVRRDDRADVLQDGLLKIHRQAGTFRGDGSASGWMCTIMTNTARSHLRATARFGEFHQSPSDADLIGRLTDSRTPATVSSLDRMLITEALLSLHPELRRVLLLTEIAGMSVRDIATELGVPTGTVKSRRSRARSQLADRLREAGVAPATMSGRDNDYDRRP
jgi:RNA polymerase sigma-70 factor (ECF subfamily)